MEKSGRQRANYQHHSNPSCSAHRQTPLEKKALKKDIKRIEGISPRGLTAPMPSFPSWRTLVCVTSPPSYIQTRQIHSGPLKTRHSKNPFRPGVEFPSSRSWTDIRRDCIRARPSLNSSECFQAVPSSRPSWRCATIQIAKGDPPMFNKVPRALPFQNPPPRAISIWGRS